MNRLSKRLNNLSSKQLSLLLILPALIYLLLTFSFPFLYLIISSLSHYNLALESNFVGINNYINLFNDPSFWASLKRSFIYTFGSLLIFLPVGFAVALSIDKFARFQSFLIGISLLPWLIPPSISATLWRWNLNTEYGIINDILVNRLHIVAEPLAWLSKSNTAMQSIIFVDAWTRIPFVALLLLAGLKAISPSLYEAAEIDGAGSLQRFHYITLPNLKYTLTVVLSVQTMFAFRFYAIMDVMTDGGPGHSTELLVKYITDMAFKDYSFGISAAASVVMLCFSIVFIIFYLKVFKIEF